MKHPINLDNPAFDKHYKKGHKGLSDDSRIVMETYLVRILKNKELWRSFNKNYAIYMIHGGKFTIYAWDLDGKCFNDYDVQDAVLSEEGFTAINDSDWFKARTAAELEQLDMNLNLDNWSEE